MSFSESLTGMPVRPSQRPRIVLLCGMLGITRFPCWDYFKGVRPILEGMGFDVLIPQLPWGQTIQRRSESLANQLKYESGPFHLIAHSMGGVDARYYITHLGGHEKTASLTTLATPHQGSIIADHEMQTWYSPYRHLPAVPNLTRLAMKEFNARTPDHGDVAYRSYSASRCIQELPWLTRRFGRLIEEIEGKNDSQVSIASAQWGEHLRTLEADHFELIGMNIWLNPFSKRARFDHLPVYRDIAAWIAQYDA
ncbi:MAG: alpha/beta hydrolase [Mariprofundaceae bacterium]|nr:alpha/beta hydrolase [Mariprofundaceae bacterium]